MIGCAGFYQVIVTDAQGCTDSEDVFVWSLEGPEILALNVIHADPGVNNGVIEIVGSGNGVLHYSLDGIIYQDASIFTNLPEGTYSIYIRDENGCVSQTELIEVLELTSAEKLTFHDFKLYPNPVDEIRYVEAHNLAGVQISDLKGTVVAARPQSNAHQISTSGILPGMYLVRISDGVNVKFQKLVIN